MAKKKNRSSKPNDLVTVESSVKKLQSLLTAPEMMGWVQSGNLQGVREKLVRINFMTIRNLVDRIPLLNAVINAQIDHVRQYCHFTVEKNMPGFTLVKTNGEDMDDNDKEIQKKLVEFIEQTGFNYDDEREDDFSDYAAMFTRETLVIDQVATELQHNRVGDAIAFWLLDAAYIKRVNPNDNKFGKNVRYIQQIENKIYNQYTSNDLLFDYKNMRADLRFRGWGYSITEQTIDLITTLLFSYNYIRDQLLRDRLPKGIITVMGDVGQPQLDSIRRYWYAAMSGAGGQWNLPIVPSGKDGVGIDFKTLQPNNRDMEFHKLIMFVSSIIAAVSGMDLAELGIKADDSTSLIGENSKGRVDSSRGRWLRAQLMYLQQHTNKVLRKITKDWTFKFVGIDKEDEKQTEDIRKTALETRRTINELRKEAGDPPIDKPWANVVLNPQAIQMIMLEMQNEQQAQGEGGEGGDNFDTDIENWNPEGGDNFDTDVENWNPEGDEKEDDSFDTDIKNWKPEKMSKSQRRREHITRIIVE